jgi:dTDP-4-dehydrorhamnose reductase
LDFLCEVRRNKEGDVISDPLSTKVLAALAATDKQNSSNKAGKYNEHKNVTVFEFMNNIRTDTAAEAERQRRVERELNHIRKQEVKKNLRFDDKKMKSLF